MITIKLQHSVVCARPLGQQNADDQLANAQPVAAQHVAQEVEPS